LPRSLVTGGAGFIGSNLANLLLEKGHEVVVLDDFSSGYRVNLDGLRDVRVIEADVRDADAVSDAMEQVETVFHLAASVGNKRSIERPVDDADVNLLGTLRVLEAARRSGVRKVVFSSSAAIFGELKVLPIPEEHPLDPDSPYGVSKLAAEKMCLAYAKLYELEAICLRYFNVYGPHQRYDAYGNVIPIFAYQLASGETLTVYDDGEQTRDFVNVRDVASANLLASQARGISGAFNVASATSVTINQLIELMGSVSGITPKVQHAEPRKGDVRHSLADITAVKAALGYEPRIELRDGLKEYLEWVFAEGVR
jgi:UDP-glucose 4-epimerase